MDLLKESSKFKFKSQRQRVSPFPNYMSMESACLELNDYLGLRLKNILLIFQDRLMDFFVEENTYNRVGRQIVEKLYNDPKIFTKLAKQQKEDGKKLVEFSKKVSKKARNKIDNRGLCLAFKKYDELYKRVYAPYSTVWIIEDLFNAELLKIVEKKENNHSRAIEYLNILTKEPKAMVERIEREALWKLASEIYAKKKWVDIILKKDWDKIRKEKDLYRIIRNHEKKYFWLTRDYEDPILDFKEIVKKLSECFNKNPKVEYEKMRKQLENLEKDRERVIEKLKLNKKEIDLFKIMREIGYIKELRKRYVSESLYYFDDVLKAIAKKSYLSLKQVRLLRTLDVKKILIDKIDMMDEINKRMKLSVWFTTNGKNTQVITGDKAKKIWEKFCGFNKNTSLFSGMTVSPGKVRGKIKIVMNPDEIDKVEKGDIILSVQVVPSFAKAILKAKALVCDGGHGITTHPAILSREAGIPCVIQTRFARKVLKDGDMVEVDGYKGVVRKL